MPPVGADMFREPPQLIPIVATNVFRGLSLFSWLGPQLVLMCFKEPPLHHCYDSIMLTLMTLTLLSHLM